MLLVAVIVAATVVTGNAVVTSIPSSCISWLTKMVWTHDVAMPVSVLSLSNTVGCFYTLFSTFSLLFSGFIHYNHC